MTINSVTHHRVQPDGPNHAGTLPSIGLRKTTGTVRHGAWGSPQTSTLNVPQPAALQNTPLPGQPLPIKQNGTQQTTPPQKDTSMSALRIIKLFYSGLVAGTVGFLVFGVAPKVAYGNGIGVSILECILANKIYSGKSPLAQKLLTWSNRMVNGPNKPISQLTPEEKRRCIAPISALVTTFCGLIFATVNFVNIKRQGPEKLTAITFAELKKQVGKTFHYSRHLLRVQTHLKPALGQKLGPALKVIGNGLVTGLRAAGRFLNGFGPMRWVKQHPALMFPMALVSGVMWGLMEGLAAQKLAKSKKMNNLLQGRLA